MKIDQNIHPLSFYAKENNEPKVNKRKLKILYYSTMLLTSKPFSVNKLYKKCVYLVLLYDRPKLL